MNDHDIVDRLRSELADRHHVRPVDGVLARGRTLRGRRRRPYALAAVGVLGAAGVTAGTTLGHSSPAFADWSAAPELAPPDVVAAIDAGCRTSIGTPANAVLALVDRRGANAVAVYTSRNGDYLCTRFQGSGGPGDAGWWTQGGGSGGTSVVTDTGAPFQVVDLSSAVNVHEGSMTAISGRVRADVARVTVTVSGRSVEGAVGGGAFDVWWPAVGAGDTQVHLRAATSDGTTVGTLDLTVAGLGLG